MLYERGIRTANFVKACHHAKAVDFGEGTSYDSEKIGVIDRELIQSKMLAIGIAISMSSLLHSAIAIELNPGSTTYDHHPSVSIAPDGTTWVAWHTYKDGSDGIAVRRSSSDERVTDTRSVNQIGIAHGPPTIIATSANHASVVWSAKVEGIWQVTLREWINDRWCDSRCVSNVMHDAIYPTAARDGEGRLVIAWSERIGNVYRIRVSCAGDDKMKGQLISIDRVDAYRPKLALHDNELWVFWDQYDGSNYSVHGCRLFPKLGGVEQLSPDHRYCLTPTALSGSDGLYVAWLCKADVIGGPGVISQRHWLCAAVREDGKWRPVIDAAGKSEGAEITHGLMAKISPQVVATGGYLGSRVRPMLHSDGARVWMLWERKSDHRGSTPRVSGDLLGRPIASMKWQMPVLLHNGFVDYHVVESVSGGDEQVSIVASRLPSQGIRTYEQFDVELTDATPLKQEKWTGWKPIALPIQAEQTPRHEITAKGKTYKLFWGDLHCHNNLSADAEGEVDELNHYARDRAGLDVVVFTNNDFYNVPLTTYEYEIGNLFAKNHSSDGKFLSFPGYEWTSRIPGVRTAALSDPGNWLPPYRNRSYANHRSVIYPPSGGPLVHFTEVGNDIAKLNEAVASAGGITLSQHPTFQLSGHAVEVGLELTSGWSNYIAKNPKLFHASLDRGRQDRGMRLGFVANGDSHRRAPGLSGALTGIYAESLTHGAILHALRERRCFATSGSQIFVDARCGDALMGREVEVHDGQIALTLHAIGTRAITSVTLVRDGKEIVSFDGAGMREFRAEYIDKELSPGVHWYYWRIVQERTAPGLPGNLMVAHGHLAWSSPHWVVVE